MSNGQDCLCLIVTGGVPFQVPINPTLAISLPKACNQSGVPLNAKPRLALFQLQHQGIQTLLHQIDHLLLQFLKADIAASTPKSRKHHSTPHFAIFLQASPISANSPSSPSFRPPFINRCYSSPDSYIFFGVWIF
ncbi:uncharacterized protein LOC121773903 [Salvia splendens]|uniref:uncharacterized protein LOC121773903 n=1 Tax=Salvia splendens TaxID=180675 RepID=UPI001C26B812|nr:uncharacterized protein LOC121773903 [Salvia splendens]